MIGDPALENTLDRDAHVVRIGKSGRRRHVEHTELGPLLVDQSHAELVEADQPAHRIGDRLVDALERQRGGSDARDLVDPLETQRPPVKVPGLLHREPELAGKARRDAAGGQPTAPAGPQ